jgi:hypothetical protein
MLDATGARNQTEGALEHDNLDARVRLGLLRATPLGWSAGPIWFIGGAANMAFLVVPSELWRDLTYPCKQSRSMKVRIISSSLRPKLTAGLATLVIVGSFVPQLAAAHTGTLNLSQDLVTLGIAATNMVPNQPSLDAGPLLQSGVGYAMANGIGVVVADPGSYYFLSLQMSNAHVQLGGNPTTPSISNLTIDFQGATLIFTHPLYYGIVFWSPVSVVVQNATIDYQPMPYTQVTVTAVDVTDQQIQYSVQPGWQNPSAFNSVELPPGSGPPGVELHIFRYGQPVLSRLYTQFPLNESQCTVINTPASVLSAVRPGDTAVITMKGFANAIVSVHSSGSTFRNITVFSAPGAGVQFLDAQSSVMERVYSIPKPGTDRLASSFGIGMFPIAGPANQIRLSRAIRTMDDGIGLIGEVIGTVQNQISSRSLTVSGSGGVTILGDGDSVPNGSPVAFQRSSDGSVLGSAIILSQSAPTGSPPQVTFNFDRDLSGNLSGTVMYSTDPNLNGAGSMVERNTVQSSSCCSAFDVEGLTNSTVRGNYIRRSAFSGLFLVEGMVSGDPPTAPFVNLNVANNVIDGTNMKSDWWWFEMGAIQTTTLTSGYDLMPTSPFSNINVTNNFIADSGRSAVWMGNTVGGSVTGNYILDANSRPDLSNADQAKAADALVPLVIDTTSSAIVTSNNTTDITSGRLFVTDTQYRELAAYAPGGTIRLNAYNLGTLSNPVVTLTDADGNTSPMTIQNTAAQALDVQLSVNVALGGALVTLMSGTTKYFGTLFIDSQDNVPAVNGCTYEISPSSTTVAALPGNLPVLVVTQAGCSYQVLDTDSFVTPGGPMTGTGSFSIGFALNSGAARMTTIEIAGQPINVTQSSAVTAASVTPSFGVGTSQTFSALYADSNGAADINTVMLNVNGSSNLANACAVEYVQASNQLFLMNDAGTTWLGPAIPGSPGALQNSQCSINSQVSSVSPAGKNLTVNYALSFAVAFNGVKSVFLNVSNNASLSSGWQPVGTWTVGLKKRTGQLISP